MGSLASRVTTVRLLMRNKRVLLLYREFRYSSEHWRGDQSMHIQRAMWYSNLTYRIQQLKDQR
jgi:hypothetical protein